MVLTLNKIRSEAKTYLQGFVPSYFITLNDAKPYRLTETSMICIQGRTGVTVDWLRKATLGSRQQRSNDLCRGFAFYEEGPSSGIVHAHLILALKNKPTRTLEWVADFFDKKWTLLLANKYGSSVMSKKYIGFGRRDHSTDVKPIHSLEGAIDYAGKEFNWQMSCNDFSPYMCY